MWSCQAVVFSMIPIYTGLLDCATYVPNGFCHSYTGRHISLNQTPIGCRTEIQGRLLLPVKDETGMTTGR